MNDKIDDLFQALMEQADIQVKIDRLIDEMDSQLNKMETFETEQECEAWEKTYRAFNELKHVVGYYNRKGWR